MRNRISEPMLFEMKPTKLTITQWAKEDRPAYRLMEKGASEITNTELLSILIGSGNDDENAIELSRRILADNENNLYLLGRCEQWQLMQYKGISKGKAMRILAAMELGKRYMSEKVEEKKRLCCSSDIYDLMRPRMINLRHEEAAVLLLNSSFRLIKSVNLSKGGLTETAVDVRIIIREALLNNATAIILCHNHPSGHRKPSREDDRLTNSVKVACETMRIAFADHLIITDNGYYSYQDEGRI